MHPPALRAAILELVDAGVNDCEIARRTGVPRTTVRDLRWGRERGTARPVCPRCWRTSTPVVFTAGDYAELLGLYLGDGHIERAGRTQSLRISLDSSYPLINDEIEALAQRCYPRNRVGRYADAASLTVIRVCHSHLSCHFPQHGPGKKHERPIVLEPWQQELAEAEPWRLLRGLIRSEGCRFINRFDGYELPSYAFANHSAGILDIFCAACDTVGVEYRRYETSVRINRRESVARCERHIGPKR